MNEISTQSIPLINEELSAELFTPVDEPDYTEMQKQLWTGIRGGLETALLSAIASPADALQSNLHRIRGYVSTAGMQRLERVLKDWETQPAPETLANEFGVVALNVAQLSLAAIEEKYPHLRAPDCVQNDIPPG